LRFQSIIFFRDILCLRLCEPPGVTMKLHSGGLRGAGGLSGEHPESPQPAGLNFIHRLFSVQHGPRLKPDGPDVWQPCCTATCKPVSFWYFDECTAICEPVSFRRLTNGLWASLLSALRRMDCDLQAVLSRRFDSVRSLGGN
jgi:hypothetical protein